MTRRISPHVSAALDFGSVQVRLPLATPGQRIGLLGGSFNPAHVGHLRLSRFALRRLQLNSIWWLVSPGNPLKSHAELRPQPDRIEEASKIAIDRRITVTGFEQDLPSAYTAASLAFLKRRYPATRFIWIMGADSLVTFDRWRRWQAILAMMPVAVIDRPGWRLRARSSRAALRFGLSFVPEARAARLPSMRPPAWTVLTVPLSPHSSTALRAAMRRPPSTHKVKTD